MKTISKAIAIASLATVATAAYAEVSLTGGLVSDYYFRGVQSAEASGYASVDYEESGFYAGVWAIDNNSQLEVDIYLGYGIELDNGFSASAGFTRYEYTSNRVNADLSQDEFNLNLGMAGFGIGYVLGSNNRDAGDQDYDVITLTYDAENWGVLVGMVDNDDQDNFPGTESKHNWAELSTSAEVAGLTVGATVGVQFNAEAGGADTASNDGYITFDISKSFDL